ncbi:MAG: helix-turn-helix transcriptional regulator [Euzebya sp.]
MRAARVLDMLLQLERGGRVTARQLSATLEVSERTVLRDVEALSQAGVPVFTTRGSGGGIQLMEGFRTQLRGLTPDEARALFLIGQPQVAHRLGLASPARTMRNKLLGALFPDYASQAQGLSEWFLHDPDPWAGHRVPHGELRRLTTCIHRRRQAEIMIGADVLVPVRPVGLVLKAGSWYLVDALTTPPGVRCLDDLRASRITRHPFTAPPDFDLARFWQAHVS